ncbi:MAG: DUF4870 domain-containing protein [Wenzhouxiangellaceae bacterium]|nr:DUF4870 domain-containing protein [Wenzhouxiangellaceae bacterium]
MVERDMPDLPEDPKQARLWATLLHLSLLAGFVVPVVGLVVPFVIYILKKDEFPSLEPHFNVIVNWILSLLVYGVISAVLVLVAIGLLLLWLLVLLALVFPIIGAIKANDGEVWAYPLSIPFLGRS